MVRPAPAAFFLPGHRESSCAVRCASPWAVRHSPLALGGPCPAGYPHCQVRELLEPCPAPAGAGLGLRGSINPRAGASTAPCPPDLRSQHITCRACLLHPWVPRSCPFCRLNPPCSTAHGLRPHRPRACPPLLPVRGVSCAVGATPALPGYGAIPTAPGFLG